MTYLFTYALGTLAPLGQASKFITLLRLNRRWTSFSAYAVSCPNVEFRRWLPLRLRLTSTSTTYLYVYDLPLRLASTTFIAACLYDLPLRPASTACLYTPVLIVHIVIVVVHFLFKRNIYLSLYVILYVLLSLVIFFLFFFF